MNESPTYERGFASYGPPRFDILSGEPIRETLAPKTLGYLQTLFCRNTWAQTQYDTYSGFTLSETGFVRQALVRVLTQSEKNDTRS